jgi:tetratricopeptide (TPR) repeat protein
MSRFRLHAAAILLLWSALPLRADDVPRGPSHEPVPYAYDPAGWKAVPRAFLDDGPACVLYAGTNFIVEPGGNVEQIVHEVTRLNNRRGVSLLGEHRSIAYDPTYQKLTLHLARVHKADGRAIDVGPDHTKLRDLNTDYQVYSGARQLVISFPDLAVGDVIEVKWGVRGKDPEGHGQFYGSYSFGNDDYPVVRDELRVLMPRTRPLRSSVRGGKLEAHVTETEEARLYHWQVGLKPALPADKDLPSKEEQRLRLHYGTFASWDEVGAWCRAVRQGCWECTPEVGRIAREVTKGLTDEGDKARALTYWVRKNVRYLSRHEPDTWAPLDPQRVFAARYGDCKDQSQMLAVLLREAGVKAEVAIISWADSGDIVESFPSPWGNHAIVLATIDGKDQWIDPVFSHAAWDALPPQDCDRLCFVMDEKGPVRLVRTPKLRPEQNRIEQTTRVKVARDGSARGEREVIYRGVAAAYERGELLSQTEAARKADALKDLQEFHTGAKVIKLTVDPRCLEDFDEPVRERVEFEVGKDFASSGSCGLSDVQVFYRLLGYRPAPDRKVPLAAGQPCEMKHRFIVEQAPGYRLADPAAATPAKSAWGRFARTTRTDAASRRIDVESHLVVEKTRVEPGEIADFTKFQKEVRDGYAVWLYRAESTDPADAAAMEADLTATPGDTELALSLARLYRTNGKPAEATRVLQGVLALASDDRVARMLLEVADEQQKAAAVARGQAHWQLARSAAGKARWAEALGEMTKAGESDPTILLSADALDLKGRICERLGKSSEAIAAYQEMLNLDPNDQRALAALIGLEVGKDQAKALDHLRRYTVAVGAAAPGLAAAADFHLRMDRLDDALDLATRSNRVVPSAAAERVLGLVHLRRGEHSEAVAHLSAALDRGADKAKPDGTVLEPLIRVRLDQGNLSAAEALAKTASAAVEPPGLKSLCATVAALGQRKAALLKEVKAPAGKAGDCAKAVERIACAEQAYADGRPVKEVEALLSAGLADGIEVGPGLALRGLLALERGRLSEALADAERAVALSPDEPRGHYVRGRVWLERADGRALAELEKAAALDGGRDAAVLHWLAAALHQGGRTQEALAAQREALRRRPDDRELAEQLRRFEGGQR